MPLFIPAITTGAGIPTSKDGFQFESNYQIGDCDTTNPCSGIKTIVDSVTCIDISGSVPLVTALMKFKNRLVGSVVATILRVATGRIMKPFSITFINGGVTTPLVNSYSVEGGSDGDGQPLLATQQGINALSSFTFEKFSGLFIAPAANLGSCDVTFSDGTVQAGLQAIDLDAIFAAQNDTEANGRLEATVTGMDNTDRKVSTVKVNATTALTVMLVKLPDGYFKSLNLD